MTEAEERVLNYRIPRDLHARARRLAAAKGQTLKGWLILTLTDAVERQEDELARAEQRRRSR